MGEIPYIGYGNDTLEKLPSVFPGYKFKCPRCGEEHELEAADDGRFLIGFYRCGGQAYLGAVNGRLVVKAKVDVSGKINL